MGTFGSDLKAWRLARGFTPKQAIAFLGVPRRSYQEWQSGAGTPRDERRVRNLMYRKFPSLHRDRLRAAERLLAIGDSRILAHFIDVKTLGRKSALDWRGLDWCDSNTVIASTLGVCWFSVSIARKREAPGTLHLNGTQRRIPWETVDWSKTTTQISKDLGVQLCQVSIARRREAPGGTHRRIPWETVDWSKTTTQIAEEFGVQPSQVSREKRKRRTQ